MVGLVELGEARDKGRTPRATRICWRLTTASNHSISCDPNLFPVQLLWTSKPPVPTATCPSSLRPCPTPSLTQNLGTYITSVTLLPWACRKLNNQFKVKPLINGETKIWTQASPRFLVFWGIFVLFYFRPLLSMTAVAGMVMSHQTLFNEGLMAPAAGSAISRQTSALRPPGDASAAELCLTQGHTLPGQHNPVMDGCGSIEAGPSQPCLGLLWRSFLSPELPVRSAEAVLGPTSLLTLSFSLPASFPSLPCTGIDPKGTP